MNAICCICTRNYLPFANTLYYSIRSSGNHEQFFCLVFDTEGNEIDLLDGMQLVRIDELNIDNIDEYFRKYNAFEMSNFLRPYLFEYLLFSKGIERLLYFDCDIYVLSSLTQIFTLLSNYSILLTPHLYDFVSYKKHCSFFNDLELFKFGIYNSGFYGLSKSNETYEFLNWLKGKSKDYFFNSPERFMFVDQKWLDLVPVLFNNVLIYKCKQANVGPWNLHERKITYKDGKFYVDDKLVLFFHFSGFNVVENPKSLCKYKEYDKDLHSPDNIALKILADQYVKLLFRFNYKEMISKEYKYAQYHKKSFRTKKSLALRILKRIFYLLSKG